jgi:hypothetical protein
LWPESVIAEQPLQGSIDCIAVFLLTRVGTASWPAPDRSWRQFPFGFHRENSRAFCITRKGLICVKFFTIINNALYAREPDVRTPTEQRRNWDAIARNAYCQEGSTKADAHTKADAKLLRGVVLQKRHDPAHGLEQSLRLARARLGANAPSLVGRFWCKFS